MRGNLECIRSLQRLLLAIAFVGLMIAWAAASSRRFRIKSSARPTRSRNSRAQEFGQLSAAERIFVRGAASRDLRWVGPNDNPDDPANDPAKTEKWSPDRSISAPGSSPGWSPIPKRRHSCIRADPESRARRSSASSILSYRDVARPLTLIRCAIPDGIDFSNASIAGIELRSGVTGPIIGDFAHIKGDLALHFGHYGALSIFRTTIGGDFDCSGADFTGSGVTDTISAQESSIGGDASFVQNFTTDGTLYFRLARIGRSLSFNHARFVGSGETGLDAQRATRRGSALLGGHRAYAANETGSRKRQRRVAVRRSRELAGARQPRP